MTLRDDALKLHLDNNGKIEVKLKVPLANNQDLSLAYTPGVAEPCKEIKENEDLSFDMTCRGNTVAVISDGTRVLGLGNIGAAAAIPVMEGKSALFKAFGDVDAFPICIKSKNVDDIVKTVEYLNTKKYAGIKIHSTYVIENTALCDMYRKNDYVPLGYDEYMSELVYIISHISPDVIIHRISGDPPKETFVAPEWMLHKKMVINHIEEELTKKQKEFKNNFENIITHAKFN